MHHSPKANLSGSSDMLQDFFGPVDQSLSSISAETVIDHDDFFTSPESFSVDMPDVDIFGTADFFPTGIDNSSNGSQSLSDAVPGFDDAASELFALSVPSSTPTNFSSTSREVHNYEEAHATESPCSCLVQALGLMKQLVPSSSNACMTTATQGPNKATAIPTIQAVISRNEATMEAVGVMLNCSCSQDGYLLTVISLIIYKILGWYAAVARKTSSLESPQAIRSRQSSPSEQVLQNSKLVGSYCLDGADSVRMAAQLVLSELHRVRRLVEQLSSKLKMQAAKKGREVAETPKSLDFDHETTLPLSAAMYDHLDADLIKRLKALSREMIDRLKRL